MSKQPVCLTIAGLDPSGGAGVVADIKTFSAFGCFATAAVTSITFQNTTGVFGAVHQSGETIRGQVEPIIADFDVDAVKSGMLPTREAIVATAALISEHALRNFVVDPVMRSTSGFDLIDDHALRALIEVLFPLSSIVTPNIPEAERITGFKLVDRDSIEKAARAIRSMGARNVLIKGGHLEIADRGLRIADFDHAVENESLKVRTALDFLFLDQEIHVLEAPYIESSSTHGTGCTLSAAIAANLALGKPLLEAVRISKDFVHEAIRTAPKLGHGHSPINIRSI